MAPFDLGAVLTPLVATGEGLAAWQIGIVAFAFIAYVLIVTALLERWEVGLHA